MVRSSQAAPRGGPRKRLIRHTISRRTAPAALRPRRAGRRGSVRDARSGSLAPELRAPPTPLGGRQTCGEVSHRPRRPWPHLWRCSVDARSFEEHRRTQERRLSGRCCLNRLARCVMPPHPGGNHRVSRPGRPVWRQHAMNWRLIAMTGDGSCPKLGFTQRRYQPPEAAPRLAIRTTGLSALNRPGS